MKFSLILLLVGLAALTSPVLADDLTIGFIYVGPKDDYGYNQAHALGAASVTKLPGVKVLEEANVPETVAVQETMRDMVVQDNAHCPLSDVVRLLRSAYSESRQAVPKSSVLSLRRLLCRR